MTDDIITEEEVAAYEARAEILDNFEEEFGYRVEGTLPISDDVIVAPF